MKFLCVARPFHLRPLFRWFCYRSSSTSTTATTLFVGGLSYHTNEPALKDVFEPHGEILEVKVVCHHVSGRSKGYGFVNFTKDSSAAVALKEMNDKLLDGRNIRVEYARGRLASMKPEA